MRISIAVGSLSHHELNGLFLHCKPENLKGAFSFGEMKIAKPLYSVELIGCGFVIVEASSSNVDTEKGIVTFQSGDSVEAMFRLEDVKEFWRIH